MAYTPTVWATGDTVTADKLNNVENGIKSLNTLVVKIIDNAMNRTFKQIADAYKVAHPVIILDESTNDYTQISKVNTTYRIIECGFGIFSASSDSDYPELEATIGGLVVHSVYDETTQKYILDKTWTEIYNALIAGNNVCIIEDNREFGGALNIWADLIVSDNGLSTYSVGCNNGSNGYTCDNANDYPSMNA